MKHPIYLFFSILSLFILPVSAQISNPGTVVFENVSIVERDGVVDIHMSMNLGQLHLGKQDLMILVPVLQQQSGEKQFDFDPVLIAGKTRFKVLERTILLNNYQYGALPSQYVKRENGQPQMVDIDLCIPFEEWMRTATLTFRQSVTGCRDCPPCFAEYKVDFRLPEPFVPVFHVAYIIPEPEPVKRRSETYQARLNFVVDKYDLLRDFGNNRKVLDEVDRIISEIRSDEALTVETLAVTGYASPEGNYDKNMILSKNRAYAFVNYLAARHQFDESMIRIDWKGEDWEGLCETVENSDIQYKSEVLDIIHTTEQIPQRKGKLQNLRDGSVYNYLLNNFYPPLRRNEYMISYVARAFDLEEAKVLIRTKPQYLSLNEMFLVANSYPKESAEFKEVFDIATRMFPGDEVARVNCAAQEIERGQYEAGIKRVLDVDRPEAWNNRGVAHAEKGEWTAAGEFFERAAGMGLEIAKDNLHILKQAVEAGYTN